MKLTDLRIELEPSYSKNAGKYTCTIEYEDRTGNVKLNLDEKVSEALLICIGEVITEFAAKAAQKVQASIIASVEDARNIKNPAIALSSEPTTPEQ